MDLNDIISEIMDLITRFESLWNNLIHPNKHKDQLCTLLYNKIYALKKLKTTFPYIQFEMEEA